MRITDAQGNEYELPGPYGTLDQIKQANTDAGQYWFSNDTLAFFKSKFPRPQRVYFGRLFISSEKGPHQSSPLFSVRIADDDGTIATYGEFQQYRSAAAAERAILALYAEWEKELVR